MERYINFVKEWATRNNMTYMCSISDARFKADYKAFKETGKVVKPITEMTDRQRKVEEKRKQKAYIAEQIKAKQMVSQTPEIIAEPISIPSVQPTSKIIESTEAKSSSSKEVFPPIPPRRYIMSKPLQDFVEGRFVYQDIPKVDHPYIRAYELYKTDIDLDYDKYYDRERNRKEKAFTSLLKYIAEVQGFKQKTTWLDKAEKIIKKYDIKFGNYGGTEKPRLVKFINRE